MRWPAIVGNMSARLGQDPSPVYDRNSGRSAGLKILTVSQINVAFASSEMTSPGRVDLGSHVGQHRARAPIGTRALSHSLSVVFLRIGKFVQVVPSGVVPVCPEVLTARTIVDTDLAPTRVPRNVVSVNTVFNVPNAVSTQTGRPRLSPIGERSNVSTLVLASLSYGSISHGNFRSATNSQPSECSSAVGELHSLGLNS